MNTSPASSAHRALLPLIVLLFAAALGACDLFDGSEEEPVRIVIGESVDGVPLGADTLLVRRTIGRPTTIERKPGSLTYRYQHGPHAGFEIHYTKDRDNRLGESTIFALSEPYAGRTGEGIGLGTPRETVREHLGEPAFSTEGSGGLVHERYEALDAHTSFLYDDAERVMSITMRGPLD